MDTARCKGFELYVCNNAYQLAPDASLLYAVNYGWWLHYFSEVEGLPCEKWTTNAQAARDFRLNHIRERNAKGLSQSLEYVHHGHGSGYTLVNLAYLFGAERIVLLGYDLKYAPDYDGKTRRIGKKPRHFFGEYPSQLQHWPSVKVRDGVHYELVELYRSIHSQGLVEVINCTPGSAIDCFPKREINAL